MRPRPIHLDLLEQRKRDAMIDLTRLLHHLIGQRLLRPELVARKTQDHQPPVLIGLVKPLQPLELRRQPTLRGRIDD